MASSYPTSVDAPSVFGTPAGSSLVTSPDHAASHTDLATGLGSVEAVIGTTGGTAIGKNIPVGKFAVSDNGGTFSNGIIGTPTITGGTYNTGVFGTPAITGGTIGTSTIGTSLIQGGTVNNAVVGSPAITGGTGNAMILGTPTIGTITVPGTTNPLGFSAAIQPAIGSFNDGTAGTITGTHTANAQSAQIFYSVMGTGAGNRTIGTPLNPQAGQSLTYAFKSSGSANGTLVWQSAFTFSQDIGTPTIGTSTFWHYYAWRYNGITSRWEFMGQSKNIG